MKTTGKYLDAKLKLLDPRYRELEPADGDCACAEMQVRKINPDARTVEAIVSTPEIDRYEEIIEPRAFKRWLKYFKANPVMLAAHDHSGFATAEPTVIGRWSDLSITDEGLAATAEFMPEDALAEKYWKRYRDGYMKAFSVGFLAHGWEMQEFDVDGGKAKKRLRVFTEVELLEISAVAVGANRGALARAASFAAGVPAGDHDAGQSAAILRALEELIERKLAAHDKTAEAAIEKHLGAALSKIFADDPESLGARHLWNVWRAARDIEGLSRSEEDVPPIAAGAGGGHTEKDAASAFFA